MSMSKEKFIKKIVKAHKGEVTDTGLGLLAATFPSRSAGERAYYRVVLRRGVDATLMNNDLTIWY